ncbi:MAG: PhzF family phenazine biosynthesis protein, partial [Acidimicrobiia bacterium]
MPRHCYVLRVFTRDGSGGNPLGVVTDILGLDDVKMQQIATDLAFSETIFLSWFEGTMPKARIFTPKVEIPYAGHPLVGAAWILLNLGPIDPGGIECSVGPVKIRQVDEMTWIEGVGDQPVRAVSPDLGPGLVPIDSAEVLMPTPYLVVQVRTAE